MGGDLGAGGRSLQNLRWETAHASVPPIFVIGNVAKYGQTKIVCQGVTFLSEIDVFRKQKGHICYVSDVRQQRLGKRRYKETVDD